MSAKQALGEEQIPAPGELNLDHIAHWVPNIEVAGADLARLGFSLTPYSEQSNRLSPTAPPVPAGAGNRCIMLEKGYLEFLSPTANTEVGEELRRGIERYVGVHLLAFGGNDTDAQHRRLNDIGFAQRPLVKLSRAIRTEAGADETARFTVARATQGSMEEGRVQCLTHHTPELLWQARYVEHCNGAIGLNGVVVAVHDVDEAAERFSRYVGYAAQPAQFGKKIALARGSLCFVNPNAIWQLYGAEVPTLPFIFGHSLQVRDVSRAETIFAEAGCRRLGDPKRWSGNRNVCMALPLSVGGHCLLTEAETIDEVLRAE